MIFLFRIIFRLALIFSCVLGLAQSAVILKKANQYYLDKSYSMAIERYEEYMKYDTSNHEAMGNLAESYRILNYHDKAVMWFSILDRKGKLTEDEHFHFGQSLMQQGLYQEAKTHFIIYSNSSMVHALQADKLIKAIDNRSSYLADSALCKIKKANFNSANADFGPVSYKNSIVFASARTSVKPINRNHSWTDGKFYGLYTVSNGKDTNEVVVKKFYNDINSRYNDGPVCFSPDGKFMYLTRNRVDKKDKGEIKLEIVIVGKNEKGEFSPKNSKPFQYNSKAYNVAHASISPDGKTLFFSSDMDGGTGGMDLYMCEEDTSGWSKPKNLGTVINTMGNEVFPFIDSCGYLFYSSNGLDGLGGLDIYEAQWLGKKKFKAPENLGYPINSAYDDLGIFTDSSGRKGFFSSNRGNHGLDDDIYNFQSTKPRRRVYSIEAYDSLYSIKLDTISYTVKDLKAGTTTSYNTSKPVELELVPGQLYEISAKTNRYTPVTRVIKAAENPQVKVPLQRNVKLMFNAIVYANNRDMVPVSGAKIAIRNKDSKTDSISTDNTGNVRDVPLGCENEFSVNANHNGKTTSTVVLSTKGLANDSSCSYVFYMEMLKDVCFKGKVLTNTAAGIAALDSVLLSVHDAVSGARIGEAYSDREGLFSFCDLFPNKKYNIHVHKLGYFAKLELLDTKGQRRGSVINRDIVLDKIVIGKAIKLEKIYFDVKKFAIRPDAAKELDKVVALLTENPDLVIELSSHTDCRGSAPDNYDLSDRRAKASSEYIISKGVQSIRVFGRGYGELKPVNHCHCEGSTTVPCTEKEHQANRRTEFRVVGYIRNGQVYFDPSISQEMENSSPTVPTEP